MQVLKLPAGEGHGRCCFTIWMSQSLRASRGRGPGKQVQQPLSSLQPTPTVRFLPLFAWQGKRGISVHHQ